MHKVASYSTGSLVKTRGREWVVLPESADDWLILRPLGGGDREIAGIYLPLRLRSVVPATFRPADPTRAGRAFCSAIAARCQQHGQSNTWHSISSMRNGRLG